MSPIIQEKKKKLLKRFILSVVLQRTVRFLTIVIDIVLKHVSIVWGKSMLMVHN